MKRNLFSISQFCKTNKTSVEFLPSSFCVKDLQIGAILLHEGTKDSVYEWLTKSSSQQHISLIIFLHPHYICPLHITNYSGLLSITPNFVSLTVCVSHGFDCTRCINLLLDPRPITPVMFVLLSQYFICLLLILLSLGLMSPLFPHGFWSLSSTRPRLQHPWMWIIHPTLSIQSSRAPLP